MEYLVNTRSKRTRTFVEAIMPSLISQLGLERSKKFVLIDIGQHSGEGNEGMTMPLPDLDTYVVSVRPAKWHQMGITLAHEMVHVKQLAKGKLKTENGVKIWCGKRYSKRTKYLEMPWELEAFAKQEIIFRRAIEK